MLDPELQALINAEYQRVNGHQPAQQTPRFDVVQFRAGDARPPSWAFQGYVKLGALNALIGVGGAGKGTFVSWLLARWSLGELPGEFQGTPINSLVVGDEDDRRESWIPRVHVHGGVDERVFALDYADGVALDLERDLPALEDIVRDHDLRVIYLDAVLDHLAGGRNSHNQHDVRQALSPLRGMAHRLGVAVLYTLHSNKMTAGTTRDRAGGSGQFTDVARSALLVGYHPDEAGVRVVARGKGNIGAVPPALRFRIEQGFMVNPETRQAIDVGVIADLEPDSLILADDVCSQPPREREPTKQATAEDVMRGIGADGGWHTRKEAETACTAAGMSERTFQRSFDDARNTHQPGGAWIETRQNGMEKEWRLLA